MPRTAALALPFVLCCVLASALAMPASASRCTVKKLSAGARYFDSVAKCEGKALAKRRSLDPLCLGRAQTKYFLQVERAERKDDCLTLGDALPLQDVLDDALPDVFDILETKAMVCCETSSNVCLWRASAGDCNTFGGTPGAAGTVCDASGACVAPPALSGTCCEQLPDNPLQIQCAAGPTVSLSCESEGGIRVAGGACQPSGYCLAPGEKPPSKCTSRKLKAAGHYFRGMSRCEAKALARGEPADLVCQGKARSRLARAFERAEKRGDCVIEGERSVAESELDDALEVAFGLLQPPPSLCCEGVALCLWLADAQSCAMVNGTVGAPGTVCDAATATCKVPPSAEGPCCQDVMVGGLSEATCVAGPQLTLSSCTSSSGTFIDDAVCLPSRLCID